MPPHHTSMLDPNAPSERGGSSDGGGAACDSLGTGSSKDDGSTDAGKKKKKRGGGKEGKRGKEDKEKEQDRDSEQGAPRVKTLVRKRVDPKTLFANERTMLQWLNMVRPTAGRRSRTLTPLPLQAVLLVFTSLALLAASTAITSSAVITSTGQISPNTKAVAGGAQMCGAILAPAAIVVMFYAMWQYYWRISRITDPDEDARFEDKFGPLFLVGMIIIVCSVAILISVERFSWSKFSLQHSATAAAPQGSYNGPRSSLMRHESDVGLRVGVGLVAIAAIVLFLVLLCTCQSHGFVAFRRHLWRQLGGEMGPDEGDGLLAGGKGGGKEEAGREASYGSIDAPASEAADAPPDVERPSSGGSPRRGGNAEERRWEGLVATTMPEGRTRLLTRRLSE